MYIYNTATSEIFNTDNFVCLTMTRDDDPQMYISGCEKGSNMMVTIIHTYSNRETMKIDFDNIAQALESGNRMYKIYDKSPQSVVFAERMAIQDGIVVAPVGDI